MSDVIIFGANDFAQLAKYYLEHDSEHRVICFTAHKEYIHTNTFEGLPLQDLETTLKLYAPGQVNFFCPMSPSSINRNREKVYLFLKSKGYSFINYISSRATILSEKIGENCFILENNVIQPYVTIGNNVIMWSGNHIGHHSIVDDSTFIASHSVVSGHVTIEKRCYLGVNSTISNGVHLSEETLVGAGALVNYNTESQAVIPGNKSIPSKVKSHRIRGI